MKDHALKSTQHRIQRHLWLIVLFLVGLIAFVIRWQVSDFLLRSEGYCLSIESPAQLVTTNADASPVRVVCQVRNVTSETIRITGVESSCDCVTPTNLPLAVGPKKKADLVFSVLTRPKNEGETFVRKVRIYVDRPSPPLILQITTKAGTY